MSSITRDLPPKLAQTLELLELMPDKDDRIQLLIDLAGRFQGVPTEVASRPFAEEHRVPGCESEAFVWARPRPDGTLDFHFAVENPQGISAMAMAVILGEGLSGAPLSQVATVPPSLVYDVFGRELSMGKSMGLMGMVSMVTRAAERRLPS
jgi:cysteine desulfuration protein SufE